MPRSQRARRYELPLCADHEVADVVLPDAFFLAALCKKLSPFLELTTEPDAHLDTGKQPVSQAEREVPMLAIGIVFVGSSGLELELARIHRVRIINRQGSASDGDARTRQRAGQHR